MPFQDIWSDIGGLWGKASFLAYFGLVRHSDWSVWYGGVEDVCKLAEEPDPEGTLEMDLGVNKGEDSRISCGIPMPIGVGSGLVSLTFVGEDKCISRGDHAGNSGVLTASTSIWHRQRIYSLYKVYDVSAFVQTQSQLPWIQAEGMRQIDHCATSRLREQSHCFPDAAGPSSERGNNSHSKHGTNYTHKNLSYNSAAASLNRFPCMILLSNATSASLVPKSSFGKLVEGRRFEASIHIQQCGVQLS